MPKIRNSINGRYQSINLKGLRFGRLIVIRQAGRSKYGTYRWLCRCDCGKTVIVSSGNIGRSTKSCGCARIGTRTKNITGQRFGRLIAIERIFPNDDRNKVRWRCLCDCGRKYIVRGTDLRSGNTVSCGCTPSNYRHGQCRQNKANPVYWIWNGMRDRCSNPKNNAYKNYGGRGIKVCELWQNNFSAFYAYIGDKPTPEHTIDRINNNGNYEPGNVRWATRKEQIANRRPQKRIELFTMRELKAEIKRRNTIK